MTNNQKINKVTRIVSVEWSSNEWPISVFFLSVDVAQVSSLVGLLTTERIRVFGKSSVMTGSQPA